MELFLGFVIAVVLGPVAIWLGPRLGLMDRPTDDPLKIHRRPVPRTGGLAVLAALVPAAFFAPLPGLVLAGGVAVWALGVFDDRFGLPAALRLVLESIVGLVGAAAMSDGQIWRILLGAVLIVVTINAANLFDGLDALLSGTVVVSAAGLGFINPGNSSTAWLLAGALLGVLLFNLPPARIFLGDAGSYLVGYALGILVVANLGALSPGLGAVLALGLIGGDFALTVVRRKLAGRPLFVGDRSHLYDQLLQRGRSVWQTLGRMWLGHAVLVVTGVAVAASSGGLALTIFAIVAGLAVGLVWLWGFVEVST